MELTHPAAMMAAVRSTPLRMDGPPPREKSRVLIVGGGFGIAPDLMSCQAIAGHLALGRNRVPGGTERSCENEQEKEQVHVHSLVEEVPQPFPPSQ